MTDLSWQLDANCITTDPELFFDPERLESAKKVCAACPVAQLCLQYAFEIDASEGVFGGLTAKERQQLKKKLNQRKIKGITKR